MVATLAQLNDARSAYHKLQTGVMPRVIVDQNGDRVEFTAANATRLYNYVQQLEQELGIVQPCMNNGPAEFYF